MGDAAEFSVDAYPGETFHGKVESLSPATGARFALLPPDNATGNFTKVVQRVPVRIAVDSTRRPTSPDPLRPGMSVDVARSDRPPVREQSYRSRYCRVRDDGAATRGSRVSDAHPGTCDPSDRGMLCSVTFQRKLLFGFSLMVLPALLVGAEAIRSNALERRALTGAGREHGAHPHLRRAGDRDVRPERAGLALSQRARSDRPPGVHADRPGGGLLAGSLARRSSGRRRWRWPMASAGIQRQIVAVADSVFRSGRRGPPRGGATGSPSASSRAGCSPRSPR